MQRKWKNEISEMRQEEWKVDKGQMSEEEG